MKQNECMLTQKRLKELLVLNRRTGIFTARIHRRNIKGVGQPVGWTDSNGYSRVSLDGYEYFTHRLVWMWVRGEWPEFDLDHKDHDVSNNRFNNLRKATAFQNGAHKRLNKNSTSGYKGVTWYKRQGRWHVQIGKEWQRLSLGYFDDAAEAAAVYDEAATRMFGQFAKTNKALGLLP